jgi:hypothetical protein
LRNGRKIEPVMYEFLYSSNRYDENLKLRRYKAKDLDEACQKMSRYLQGLEDRTEVRPWVDEDVIKVSGKHRTTIYTENRLDDWK